MTDLELAEQAVRAAAAIALERQGESLSVIAKESPADVATEVDREAEAAAEALIARHRPADRVEGEEGAQRPGEGEEGARRPGEGEEGAQLPGDGEEGAQRPGRRRWLIDALDGTLNYVNGLPGWCAAVTLEGEVAAVYDPVRDELFTAARGQGARRNGEPIAVKDADSLETALVATFLHQPKIPLPGVLPTLTALLEQAGSVRMTGSGTLELARVAAGQLHGWIQPATYAWDWLPGALLVTEAGGIAQRLPGDPDWYIAGAPRTFQALKRLRPADGRASGDSTS